MGITIVPEKSETTVPEALDPKARRAFEALDPKALRAFDDQDAPCEQNARRRVDPWLNFSVTGKDVLAAINNEGNTLASVSRATPEYIQLDLPEDVKNLVEEWANSTSQKSGWDTSYSRKMGLAYQLVDTGLFSSSRWIDEGWQAGVQRDSEGAGFYIERYYPKLHRMVRFTKKDLYHIQMKLDLDITVRGEFKDAIEKIDMKFSS